MPTQKDVHILTPRIYECVTLRGKRDFVDVLKDFEREREVFLGYVMSLYKGEAGGPETDTDVMIEAEAGVM